LEKNARVTAYRVLAEVLDEKAYFNMALKKHLDEGLSPEDKRFTTVLAAVTLENLNGIDYYLTSFITAKRVHKSILNILRLGACQIMYLHVPESAAVNESVRLAKAIGKQALAGFVNAVLRSFARGYKNVPLPQDMLQRVYVQYGFPPWMARKFIAQWGEEEAERFFAYQPDHQLTCVRMNAIKSDADEFESLIRTEGLLFIKGRFIEEAYYIRNITSIAQLSVFNDGKAAVMGEASMIAVAAVCASLPEGASVLDACSAPGGKAAYVAALKKNAIKITAWDVYEHRTELIKKNLLRLGVEKAIIETRDASIYDEKFKQQFDLVVVDAPCSALGLIQKKPDIRIYRQQEDIAALVKTQTALLDTCAQYVKKGGLLAYFTCTLIKEENEGVVEGFLSRNSDFAPCTDLHLPEQLKARARSGMITIMPHVDTLDGFFIALMERKK
jgi:16S rRNA (cytosine967-C5)-methyltransferase